MRKLSLKTYEGEYKVMIIWMPEKMHMAASNKLLKLLEEPPATTVFLLVSEEPDKILPTILSRCQLIKVPAYTDEEIEIALKNKGFEDAQLKDIARIAKGNYRRALDLASSQNEKAALLEQFIKLMRLCYSFQDKKEESLKAIYKLNEDLAGMGRENQKKFLIYSLALLRDNFILNQQTPDLVYQMPDENNFSVKFNTFVNPRNIQGLYDEFNKAHYHIESNGNAKIVFLDLALKIITWIRK
jgi:DNA polymerase-3 subunit delta'